MSPSCPRTRPPRAPASFGATILAEPFDVLDAGRMAVVQDPTGAIVCPWEPGTNIGAQYVNAPGALTWADVATPDPEAAARFYGDWLGWTFADRRRLRAGLPGDRQRRRGPTAA